MHHAIRYLDDVSKTLDDHQLFVWMTASRHRDPRRHYDSFVPCLGFILAFPFYNERYLRYDRADNDSHADLCAAINEQAEEDRTHSRLFLRDLRNLDLARVWGIERPSTILWSVFASPMLAPFREMLGERIRCIVNEKNEWPPFRYLQMEELEHFGNQVFTASTKKAYEIEKQTGKPSIYFGEYHLDRESGHVGGIEFENIQLSGEEAAHAHQIIDSMHAATATMVDFMYEFSAKVEDADSAGAVLVKEQTEKLERVEQRVEDYLDGQVPVPEWRRARSEGPRTDESQNDLVAAWERHHATFSDHPFTALFRKAEGAEAGFALRCGALLFAPRICGLYDFYTYDCVLDEPTVGPGAETVQFLARMLATQSQVFFYDWEVLEMDERIPWQAPELLEWIFLDPVYGRPDMEAIHEFRREALRINNDPLIKFWAMMSVGMMARAFFREASVLAQRFADENPEHPPLAYLSNMRHLLYEDASPNWLDPGHPTDLAELPVTPAQRDYILRMMDVFATHGRRQFDNLVRALTTDRDKFAFLR